MARASNQIPHESRDKHVYIFRFRFAYSIFMDLAGSHFFLGAGSKGNFPEAGFRVSVAAYEARHTLVGPSASGIWSGLRTASLSNRQQAGAIHLGGQFLAQPHLLPANIVAVSFPYRRLVAFLC